MRRELEKLAQGLEWLKCRSSSLIFALAMVTGAGGCDGPVDPDVTAVPSASLAQARPSEAPQERREDEELLESLAGEILLPSGYVIGTIELSSGRGEVFLQPPGAGNGDMMLNATATRAGATDIVLSLVDPNDGAVRGSLSLAEMVRGKPAGTLTFMGEKWNVMVPVIAELEGPIDYDIQPGDLADDTHDAPGLGVTGPTYRLRSGDIGTSVQLRDHPDRSARVSGAVNSRAQGILMKRCRPEIDSGAFDSADPAGRRALLAQAWCEVAVPMAGDAWIEGWLPGRLLEPEI